MDHTLWIVLAALILFLGYGIMAYNSLVRGRNRCSEGWSDVEAQMKRRYDLIPNLVGSRAKYTLPFPYGNTKS